MQHHPDEGIQEDNNEERNRRDSIDLHQREVKPDHQKDALQQRYQLGGIQGSVIYVSLKDHEWNYLQKQKTKPLELSTSVLERIQSIMEAGMLKKEERLELLQSIPREGDSISLEALLLNGEIVPNLHIDIMTDILPDLKLDISERQDIILALSNIIKLNVDLRKLITIARKDAVVQGYDYKVQKILKNTEATKYLFGDDVKSLMEGAKSMEKTAKEMKPKKQVTKDKRKYLNSQRSTTQRGGRGGFRDYNNTYYRSNNNYRQNRNQDRDQYPAKRVYAQTQPQRDNRERRHRSRSRQ
ncbi:hypothetical protein QAD02_012641 [Eretmocerus hayati]|uniref:Uncharacterized protein n=1 Tax=Eretmocerus hayati TaxID=131215 RepID=A0ACC2P012_9HYME|nr:hypothetical protein QAD02_012641 [Eretmocerus hayati]